MINKNDQLEKAIENKGNSIRGDRLDMSFGEIMNLYEDGELIIAPEYQRAFRWTKEQKTDFIESILIGIPIPPIFAAETKDRKWELVDGLQRVSTILSFFGKLKINGKRVDKLILMTGKLIPELEDQSMDSISKKLANIIKRSICRVEILRWDSSMDMRYELFNRLNTTASPLTPQEIRNCVFRSDGNNFNELLQEITKLDKFKEIVDPTEREETEMFGEELVLRFFSFQDDYEIKKSLREHLNTFMKNVTQNTIAFDLDASKDNFMKILHSVKKDYFRENGFFSLRDWDGILYFCSKKVKRDEKIEENVIIKLKQEIQKAEISKKIAYKHRPKKAIEIAEIFLNQ